MALRAAEPWSQAAEAAFACARAAAAGSAAEAALVGAVNTGPTVGPAGHAPGPGDQALVCSLAPGGFLRVALGGDAGEGGVGVSPYSGQSPLVCAPGKLLGM